MAIFCRFLKDCRLYPLVLGIPSAVFGDEQWASEDSRGSLFRGSSNEIPLDLRLPRREVVGWGCTQWNFLPELVGTFWFPPYLLGYRTVIGNIDLRLDTWDMGHHPGRPTGVGVVQRWTFLRRPSRAGFVTWWSNYFLILNYDLCWGVFSLWVPRVSDVLCVPVGSSHVLCFLWFRASPLSYGPMMRSWWLSFSGIGWSVSVCLGCVVCTSVVFPRFRLVFVRCFGVQRVVWHASGWLVMLVAVGQWCLYESCLGHVLSLYLDVELWPDSVWLCTMQLVLLLFRIFRVSARLMFVWLGVLLPLAWCVVFWRDFSSSTLAGVGSVTELRFSFVACWWAVIFPLVWMVCSGLPRSFPVLMGLSVFRFLWPLCVFFLL